MYYKVLKNNKVIDVLHGLTYLKWQPKNKIMVLCGLNEAQAILSSGKNTIWHEKSLYELPAEAGDYDTVEAVEIDKYEFEQLRILNMKSPEAIIDNFLLNLIENNII